MHEVPGHFDWEVEEIVEEVLDHFWIHFARFS